MSSLRAAKSTTCPVCWQPLLVGLDNDVAALSAICDDQPLTRSGELLAVLDRRHVYEFARGELLRRDRWMIRSPRPVVVATHRCWEPIPAAWHQPRPKPAAPVEMEF